jgi:hypothetical protein
MVDKAVGGGMSKVRSSPARGVAARVRPIASAQRAHLFDMQVIVRLQNRGAQRLDHSAYQALCGPPGRR